MARLPYNAANPNAKRQFPSDGGWGYLIPRGGKNPDAAWEFAKFMSAGEGNHTFILGRNRPSPVKAYTEDPALQEVQPFMAPIIEDMEQGVAVPLTAVHHDIKLAMQDMTEDVLYYELSPAEALEKYAAEAQKVLDNYWSTYG
jgi:multiple sugar transport system substrate-binding protein